MGCISFSRGSSQQESKSLSILHWQVDSLPLVPPQDGSPQREVSNIFNLNNSNQKLLNKTKTPLWLVTQSCPTLWDPRDCSLPGSCPWGFSRQAYWSGVPCPPPGDLSNPRIKPRSPALQMDSSLTEALGKPKNTEVGSLSLLQGIFLTQELNQGLLHCRWIFFFFFNQLSYQGSLQVNLNPSN